MTDPVSPAIQRLHNDLRSDPGAIVRFRETLRRDGAPLVEPHPVDADRRLVTFVWFADEPVDTVALIEFWSPGDLDESRAMQRLAGTDLWTRTLDLPAGFRSDYRIGPGDPMRSRVEETDWPGRMAAWRQDPLNPKRVLDATEGLDAELLRYDGSLLELPDAVSLPWFTARPGVSPGGVAHHRVTSVTLDNERDVWVYHPAGNHPGPVPLLVHFDGAVAKDVMRLPRTLDNLIAAGVIPPLAAVLVGNVDRGAELPPNDGFVTFLADELLPWTRTLPGPEITDRPERTVVAGQSYGGLAASYAALTRPDVFGNVLSQSGSYWWLPNPEQAHRPRRIGEMPDWEWLPAFVAGRPVAPVRWALDAGLLEGSNRPDSPSLLGGVRQMRNLLTAQGAEIVRYHEFMGGHDYTWWRGTIADGLIALLAD